MPTNDMKKIRELLEQPFEEGDYQYQLQKGMPKQFFNPLDPRIQRQRRLESKEWLRRRDPNYGVYRSSYEIDDGVPVFVGPDEEYIRSDSPEWSEIGWEKWFEEWGKFYGGPLVGKPEDTGLSYADLREWFNQGLLKVEDKPTVDRESWDRLVGEATKQAYPGVTPDTPAPQTVGRNAFQFQQRLEGEVDLIMPDALNEFLAKLTPDQKKTVLAIQEFGREIFPEDYKDWVQIINDVFNGKSMPNEIDKMIGQDLLTYGTTEVDHLRGLLDYEEALSTRQDLTPEQIKMLVANAGRYTQQVWGKYVQLTSPVVVKLASDVDEQKSRIERLKGDEGSKIELEDARAELQILLTKATELGFNHDDLSKITKGLVFPPSFLDTPEVNKAITERQVKLTKQGQSDRQRKYRDAYKKHRESWNRQIKDFANEVVGLNDIGPEEFEAIQNELAKMREDASAELEALNGDPADNPEVYYAAHGEYPPGSVHANLDEIRQTVVTQMFRNEGVGAWVQNTREGKQWFATQTPEVQLAIEEELHPPTTEAELSRALRKRGEIYGFTPAPNLLVPGLAKKQAEQTRQRLMASAGLEQEQLEEQLRRQRAAEQEASMPPIDPAGNVAQQFLKEKLSPTMARFFKGRLGGVLSEFDASFPGAREAWWNTLHTPQPEEDPQDPGAGAEALASSLAGGDVGAFFGEGVGPIPSRLAQSQVYGRNAFQPQDPTFANLTREERDALSSLGGMTAAAPPSPVQEPARDPLAQFLESYPFTQEFLGTPRRQRGSYPSRLAPPGKFLLR